MKAKRVSEEDPPAVTTKVPVHNVVQILQEKRLGCFFGTFFAGIFHTGRAAASAAGPTDALHSRWRNTLGRDLPLASGLSPSAAHRDVAEWFNALDPKSSGVNGSRLSSPRGFESHRLGF